MWCWVVGCFMGEEVYLIVIFLDECYEKLGIVLDVKVFVIDVD